MEPTTSPIASNPDSDSNSCNSLSTDSAARPPSRTEFTRGSDLVLKSVDGVEFSAHSIILSLASPVFADMFEIGTPSSGRVIDLAETGEMIELMLKFIYPRQSPVISSFETLNKALHVAKKYQLDDMEQQLRQKMSLQGSPLSIETDPLTALGVAFSHALKPELQLATSLVHKEHDFTTVDGLLSLAKCVPDATPWVAIIGIPNVKSKVISEVLFSYHQEPMNSNLPSLCNFCQARHRQSSTYLPAEWQARWAHELYTKLMKRPIRDWKSYFDLPFLYEAIVRRNGALISTAKGTCTCLEILSHQSVWNFSDSPSVKGSSTRFSDWSGHVYRSLVSRLKHLEELEQLIA